MTTALPPVSSIAQATTTTPDAHEALRDVAEELEANFLAEMLKHAGFGEARESFGGGAGEDQFASLLRTEHARALAAKGGIGLAESIFQSLLARSPEAGSSGTSR